MAGLDKKHWWEEWGSSCPKCKSKDIESLNIYRGTYKRHIDKEKAELLGLNPDELKNQIKYKCNNCNHVWWENEGLL